MKVAMISPPYIRELIHDSASQILNRIDNLSDMEHLVVGHQQIGHVNVRQWLTVRLGWSGRSGTSGGVEAVADLSVSRAWLEWFGDGGGTSSRSDGRRSGESRSNRRQIRSEKERWESDVRGRVETNTIGE
ncbi:hypothetical protein ACFE04_000122 [Oxalis oulophora]